MIFWFAARRVGRVVILFGDNRPLLCIYNFLKE